MLLQAEMQFYSPCASWDKQSSSTEFGINTTLDLILGEVKTSVPYKNDMEVRVVSACQHICPSGICGCDVYYAEIIKNPTLKTYEAEFWNKDALIITPFCHL